MKKLALFDFDGTIINRDSMIEIIKLTKGPFHFYIGMILFSPLLILMKAGILPNSKVKQWVMQYFWGGMSTEDFNAYGKKCISLIPEWYRDGAIEKIRNYQQLNWRVIVISASAENWLGEWAKETGVELLATKLEIVDGKVTGMIEGKNCKGQEKVNRLKTLLTIEDYEEIHAYGDSSGDKELLSIAHSTFYRPFR